MTPSTDAAVRAVKAVLLNAQKGHPVTYTQEEFDFDTQRYMELDEFVSEAQSEMNAIKARFRALGNGEHTAPSGVQVSVSPPNRSFNLDRAVALLNDEQKALCKADGFDPKKVKGMLPPVVLEVCMDPGKGDMRVSVK